MLGIDLGYPAKGVALLSLNSVSIYFGKVIMYVVTVDLVNRNCSPSGLRHGGIRGTRMGLLILAQLSVATVIDCNKCCTRIINCFVRVSLSRVVNASWRKVTFELFLTFYAGRTLQTQAPANTSDFDRVH